MQFEVHKGEKEALISALQTLLTEDIDDHKGWQAATKKVVELQATWKATGFAGKEHNEALWSQFREAADVFFERKQVFYDRVKASSKVAKEKKLRIIEQAEGIQNSTDWKATTDALIRLQKEWKAAGPCAPGDEHKLWKKVPNRPRRVLQCKEGPVRRPQQRRKSQPRVENGLARKD